MKLTHHAAQQLVERIIEKANRDNNNIIFKHGDNYFVEVNPAMIRICIGPRSWSREFGEPTLDEDLFKKYVTIIKETIPKYTQELGIIDYYIGSFLGYVYDPVEKVYKLSFCRRQGAGIIEISIKEGITIEN